MGTGTFGVYTGAESLGAAVSFAAPRAVPLLVRNTLSTRSRCALPSCAIYTFDSGWWQSHYATTISATEATDPLSLVPMTLDGWAVQALAGSRAQRVLTPSAFVAANDWPALQTLVAELAATTHRSLIRFIPTDASMLEAHSIVRFAQVMQPLQGSEVGFLFGGGSEPMARKARLAGLRRILQAHPGALVIGIDPVVASDAAVHGSGQVFVGVSRTFRMPSPPGRTRGGKNSKGFMPGIFNRDLLSIRSPDIFADWYVNHPSPTCSVCRRAIDDYTSSAVDKAAIIEHNLHSIYLFNLDLLAVPASSRASWLHSRRVEALVAHHPLSQAGADLEAEMTLRRLVELDDPLLRHSTSTGLLL